MIGYERILRDPGTAIIGAAGIGAVASIIGGNQQSSAISSAANTQAASNQAAIDAQNAALDKQIALLQPFHDAGVAGLDKLQNIPAAQYQPLDVPDYQQRPDYMAAKYVSSPAYKEQTYTPSPAYTADQYKAADLKVQIPEELKAQYEIAKQDTTRSIDRAAAARGGFFSGAAVEETGRRMAALDADLAKSGYQAGMDRALADRANKQFGAQFNANQDQFAYNTALADKQFGANYTADQAKFGYTTGVADKQFGTTFNASQDKTAYDTNAANYNTAYQMGMNKAITNQQLKTQTDATNYNQALNLVNIGTGAATNNGAAIQANANNIANLNQTAGNNAAALTVAAGQNSANTLTGLSNATMSGMGTYWNYSQNKDLLDYLKNKPVAKMN